MVAITTHLRVRAIILFPYLDVWLVGNQCRLELIKDKEFTLRLITSLGLIINQEKSDLVPSQNFIFIGMEFVTLRQYCQSSLGQSTRYSMPSILVSEASCCHSKNVSLITGETEYVCSICGIGRLHLCPLQMALFAQWKPHILPPEHKIFVTEQTSFGMVVGQGQIYSRSCSQTIPSSAHSLHSCELFGLGCSFGTVRIHVSWSLATDPISTSHQHSRNEGYSFSLNEFQHILSNSSVMIATDTSSVVAYLQRESGTHSPTLCMEVWETLLWCHEIGISLRVRHIPGRTNIWQTDCHGRANQYQQNGPWISQYATRSSWWQDNPS